MFILVSSRWDAIVDKEIAAKIESIGGELIKAQKTEVSKTPFKSDHVGGTYFAVHYRQDGQERTAYYRRHKALNIDSIPSRGAPAEWMFTEGQ